MSNHFRELNIDGLVGPNHHYAGLSEGNMASTSNALSVANPQAAALQGLSKMYFLYKNGIPQAIMPPQQRPDLGLLRRLGFQGKDKEILNKAYKQAPELLSAIYSASSMWAANAATVCPSLDSGDHRLHFSVANLVSNLHRHHETDFSKQLLETIFNNEQYFVHHQPLPFSSITADEGAANHNRLCANHGSLGIHLFVYGKQALNKQQHTQTNTNFPARQTLEASKAIARLHGLNPSRVIYARQNPSVIDKGVFHNDVISVANENVFFLHEEAFHEQEGLLEHLKQSADFPIHLLEVKRSEITVEEAVSTYLFNSQILTLPDQSMMLVVPSECEENKRVKAYIDNLIADKSNPVNQVHYFDLKQSMKNGGGPACLRLRVALNEKEMQAMHAGVLLDDIKYQQLERWIKQHYRSALHVKDLACPDLMLEIYTALDELTQILNLGSIYPFQKL